MNTTITPRAAATAQHTPGPWKASHNGRDDLRVFAESVANNPRAICKVNEPLGRMLEAGANARLIAAAPALLATLERCAVMLGRLADREDRVSAKDLDALQSEVGNTLNQASP